MSSTSADSVVVIDFETTGLSPDRGDRVIEIGAVLIEKGKIVSNFQSLMNPGKRISSFIEQYTGITNVMLSEAPPVSDVMRSFVKFAAGFNLVAHNASFDKRFLQSELSRIRHGSCGDIVCSMLVARRVYQEASNYRLSTLAEMYRLRPIGAYHRALSDADVTAQLWIKMIRDLEVAHGIGQMPFSLMQAIARCPRNSAHRVVGDWAARNRTSTGRAPL